MEVWRACSKTSTKLFTLLFIWNGRPSIIGVFQGAISERNSLICARIQKNTWSSFRPVLELKILFGNRKLKRRQISHVKQPENLGSARCSERPRIIWQAGWAECLLRELTFSGWCQDWSHRSLGLLFFVQSMLSATTARNASCCRCQRVAFANA